MSSRAVTNREQAPATPPSTTRLPTAPLPIDEAHAALLQQVEPEQAFLLLLRAMCTVADEAAIFAADTELLAGHMSLRGGHLDEVAIADVQLPLECVPAAAEAVRSAQPLLAPLSTEDDATASSIVMWAGARPRDLLLLPIVVSHEVIAVAIAVRDDGSITADDAQRLVPLATLVADALERAILDPTSDHTLPGFTPSPERAEQNQPPELVEIAEDLPAEAGELSETIDRPESLGHLDAANEPSEFTDVHIEPADEPGEFTDVHIEPADEPMEYTDLHIEPADKPMEFTAAHIELADEPSEFTDLHIEPADEPNEFADVHLAAADEPDPDDDLFLVVEGEPETGSPERLTGPELDQQIEQLRAAGAWLACTEGLLQRAESDPKRTVDSLMDAANIFQRELGDADGAIAVYNVVRRHEPAHLEASDRLATLYRQRGDYEALVELLLECADHCQDTDDRIHLLLAASAVYEHDAADPEAAFLVAITALAADPTKLDALDASDRTAASSGQWSAFSEALMEAASATESHDCETACGLWVRASTVLRARTGESGRAVQAARRATELDRTFAGGLESLADALRAAGSHAELAETLLEIAKQEKDADARLELVLSAAELYETDANRPYDAIAALREALRLQPTHLPALASLERIYRTSELWEQFADVMVRAGQLNEDNADELIRIKLELAEVCARELDDADRAIALCNEVTELDPGNDSALTILELLYEELGKDEQYLDVLERQLDHSTADTTRINLYERLCTIWSGDYQRPDRAACCLQKAVDLDPEDRDKHRQLIELYRATGQWAAADAAYATYLQQVEDPVAKVDLYVAAAELAEHKLRDLPRAIALLTAALELDPCEPRALESLAGLEQATGNWSVAIEALDQLIGTTMEPISRSELCARAGYIAVHHVKDANRGEAYLRTALDAHPAHTTAVDELVKLYGATGRWRQAAEICANAADAEREPRSRAERHFQAAKLYHEQLADQANELAQLEAAVRADSEHLDSNRTLADRYFAAEQWEQLAVPLEVMIRHTSTGSGAPRDRAEYQFRAGRCAEAEGAVELAMQLYSNALTALPGHSRARNQRAELRYQQQDWAGAAQDYHEVLTRTDSPGADLSRVCLRLGCAHRELGGLRKALSLLKQVTTPPARKREAQQLIVNLQQSLRDWPAVITAMRDLMPEADAAEQAELLRRVGDIYQQHLSDPNRAAAAYHEAVRLAPDDPHALQRLLDAYTAAERWSDAVRIIEQFVTVEAAPLRRATYCQAAATLLLSKLDQPERAVAYYDRALDNYFDARGELTPQTLARALEAFGKMDAILTQRRAWPLQEQAYRRMIERTSPDDTALLANLWHALGEIYRSRLHNFPAALTAFITAQQMETGNTQRPIIIAELCALAGQTQPQLGIVEATKLVAADPYRPEPYQALYRLYREANEPDRAWCVAAALCVLDRADEGQQVFYENNRRAAIAAARNSISGETWSLLRAPAEDRYISAMFAAVCDGFSRLGAKPHTAYELNRAEAIDLARDKAPVSRMLLHISHVLGIAQPDVFVQPRQAGGLMIANCLHRKAVTPAAVLRSELSGKTERQLLFEVARSFTFLRPERYLKFALQTNAALEAALITALAIGSDRAPVPAGLAQYVRDTAPVLQRQMDRQILDQLRKLADHFLASSPKVDISQWVLGAEQTAHRVGLLLCGELRVAAAAVADEPKRLGGPSPHDKIKQLLAFSVSEAYFAARKQVGVQLRSRG